jgi:hypothetical protein
VEVYSVSGQQVCVVHARTVAELKARIKAGTGIHCLEQRLTLRTEELHDLDRLTSEDGSRLVVGLVRQRATLGGATRRALGNLGRVGVGSALVTLLEEVALAETHHEGELDSAVRAILGEAISEPEQSEGCARIALALRDFKDPEQTEVPEGEKVQTLFRHLINMSQLEWDSIMEGLLQGKAQVSTIRPTLLAFVRFLGNLFICQMLGKLVIPQLMNDLLDEVKGTEARELCVEAALALLELTGPYLDQTRYGKELMSQIMLRLKVMMVQTDSQAYPQALLGRTRDLMKLRDRGWRSSKPANHGL